MRIYFQENPARGWTLDVYIFDEGPNGTRDIWKVAVTKARIERRFDVQEPSFCIETERKDEVLAALMEGLARAGLIPKMGATEAELVATKRHLQDMRSLAFETVSPRPDYSGESK